METIDGNNYKDLRHQKIKLQMPRPDKKKLRDANELAKGPGALWFVYIPLVKDFGAPEAPVRAR